ncbi:MAG: beta-3-deoxy-D-manno-oct-2-ulosonic acid transferase [Pseudomonadota bacterium]
MTSFQPLLRAPPFPELKPCFREITPPNPTKDEGVQEGLFARLREARVGGAFWLPQWAANTHQDALTYVVRCADHDCPQTTEGSTLRLAPKDEAHAVDPWSVLPHAKHLIAHGGDEWIAIAVALGLEVEVLSPGPYGEPGETHSALETRAFHALTVPFPDPFGEGDLSPEEAITLLGDWRRVLDGNMGNASSALSKQRIVAACGMSWWKREEIRRFLWSPGSELAIHRSAARAVDAAAALGGALAVWPSRISPDLEEKARAKGVDLVRVEDGFVRSVGLGSDLVPPLSVIVDRTGIHYDPSRPSDLETLLNETQFSSATLERAAQLRATIVEARISKYGAGSAPGNAALTTKPTQAKRIVLVPGQVEDDMSVLLGGQGLASNLELLRRARKLEPDAEIWWRPHPDVDAGHREGAVDDAAAMEHAHRIVRGGSMSDLLDQVDALHTLTSLSGFEALLRGCDVTCHGVPFYAGWGLTRDLGDVPDRRARNLSLDELVAGVLLLYPRYLDPVNGLPCPAETLIARVAQGEAENRLGWVQPVRQLQGRIMRRIRAIGGGRA